METAAHSAAEDWELVAANEVHVMDALKQEGNALFQQKRYFDAIQVYARALAQLPTETSRLLASDHASLEELEIAVRLNRALAYIELHDDQLLVYAEQDCTAALVKQPDCIKALYRRALARERLGKLQDALADAERMRVLEPANPAANPLILRLHESLPLKMTATTEDSVACVANQKEAQCSITQAHKTNNQEAARSAADTWKDLQEAEQRLRKAFNQSVPPTRAVKQSRKARGGVGKPVQRSGEVLVKTESLWASLAEEEASTVARVFKNKGGERLKTASIHPSQ